MAKAPKIEQPRNRNSLIKSGNNPGSWTFHNHPEALTKLQAAEDPRLAALAAEGYVAPMSEVRRSGKRQSGKDFWARAAYLASYQEEGKEVHKMPDDWTKAKLAGDSSGGYRRTTLRTYKGAGVELRMPSVTAVKEFAKAVNNEVLDIPVEITNSAGVTLQAWVRAVKTGSGEWQTTVMGEHGTSSGGHQAAEAVAAVLESRRPTVALQEVGNLLDRRRARMATAGFKPGAKTMFGGAFKEIAYDRVTKILSMNYVGNAVGRYVEPEVAAKFINSTEPRTVWNKLINPSRNVAIRVCDDCQRRYVAGAKHVCPVDFSDAAGTLTPARRKANRTFRESAVVKTLVGTKKTGRTKN